MMHDCSLPLNLCKCPAVVNEGESHRNAGQYWTLQAPSRAMKLLLDLWEKYVVLQRH
jgi:hypothetical protein